MSDGSSPRPGLKIVPGAEECYEENCKFLKKNGTDSGQPLSCQSDMMSGRLVKLDGDEECPGKMEAYGTMEVTRRDIEDYKNKKSQE